MKKKIGSNYGILVILMFAVICVFVDYIIIDRKLSDYNSSCDCVSFNDNDVEIDNDNSGKLLYPKISIAEVQDDEIYDISINNNKVVLNEDSLGFSNITVFNNMVFFESWNGGTTFYITDVNGNILKKYFDQNTGLIGNKFAQYKIEGNDIYVTSDNLGQDDIAVVCNLKAENRNENVVFVQKLTYLSDGSFSDLVLDNAISVDEYIITNNINCFY